MTMRFLQLGCVLLLAVNVVSANDHLVRAKSTFVPAPLVLLPIAFAPGQEVRGAYGTIWRGEVWISNASNCDVAPASRTCQMFECWTMPAGFIGRMSTLGDVPDPGVVISPHLEGSDCKGVVTFSNRIFEVTRHAQPQGIEVPVVGEHDFLSGEAWLLGVPSTGVRASLRVYDPIRIYPDQKAIQVQIVSDNGTLLGNMTLRTIIEGYPHVPERPGYAAIYDLAATFPAVTSVDRYHVRLTSAAGVVYWAMISVTDNDSQQVLLITP